MSNADIFSRISTKYHKLISEQGSQKTKCLQLNQSSEDVLKKIKTFLTAVRIKQLVLKAQMEGSNEAHVIVRSARRFGNFTRK